MKKKFWGAGIALLVAAVMVTAGGCGSSSSGGSGTALTAGTYEELYDHLKSINPGGDKYDAYKDEDVVIELTGDLEAEAVGEKSDYVTGATLKIARGGVTIDGKGKKIESKGLPSFYVVGTEESPVTGIVIKNLTVNEGSIDPDKPIRGGAMYFAGYAGVELSDCVFTNCVAKTQGGGVLHTNGWGDDSMRVAIKNCTFKNNSAPDGTGGASCTFCRCRRDRGRCGRPLGGNEQWSPLPAGRPRDAARPV
jgi:hypothetical protein